MLNFYPGPSKLEANIARYYQEAVESGLLERNHRSSEFESLYSQLKQLFYNKLDVPRHYEILLLSSATEAWEVISQSFVSQSSLHLFNGAFGEKWFQYAQHIHSRSTASKFDLNHLPEITKHDYNTELIACTHNETSNGSMLPLSFQSDLRKKAPGALICYDVTSSMGGVVLDWDQGDIWFASVQKCFGLPSGLGVFIVSPTAINKASKKNETGHYNSFGFMLANSLKNQTHYTPNIANVFLLKRVLEDRPMIAEIDDQLNSRATYLYQELEKLSHLKPLMTKDAMRSTTVLTISVQKDLIDSLKIAAQKAGIILGNGYGEMKDSSVRIANFPAIQNSEYEHLLLFLREFDRIA